MMTMMTTARSTTNVSHEVQTADGRRWAVDFAPYDDAAVIVGNEDGSTTVRYVVVDDEGSCSDPRDDDTGWGFRLFDNGGQRDSWHESNELGACDFVVERYEHGLVRYALTGESSTVDRRWDVAGGVGVLTVPSAIEPTRRADAARCWLDSFTSWANGEVYGVVEQRFAADGTDTDETDSCWGFVGYDYALEILRDGL